MTLTHRSLASGPRSPQRERVACDPLSLWERVPSAARRGGCRRARLRMKLPAHNRYDYVPITSGRSTTGRRASGSRSFFSNNIEHFAFGAGLGSDSTGAAAAQSQRNYAWRDYGNRVGIWYYLDLLDEFGLPGAHNVNSAVLEYCPDIVERLNGARRRICRPRPHQLRAPGRAVGGGRGAADRRMHRDRRRGSPAGGPRAGSARAWRRAG